MPHRNAERPIGELFSSLGRDMGLLVRQEIELARVELSRKAARLGRDAASMGIGGAVAYAGAMALVAGIVLGLIDLGVTPWLAAMIVGAALALVGFGLIKGAQKDVREADLAPRRTARTIKDDVQWAKEQVT